MGIELVLCCFIDNISSDILNQQPVRYPQFPFFFIWTMETIVTFFTRICTKFRKESRSSEIELNNVPIEQSGERTFQSSRQKSVDSLATLVEVPAVQGYTTTTPRGVYR